MRHVGAGERRQHARLAAQHVVARRPQVRRRAAQDVVAPAAREAHQDVLRAAGERLDTLERAAGQPLRVHPPREHVEVTSAGSMP